MRTTISMLSVAALVLSGVFTTDFGSAWAQTPSCDFMTGGGFIVFSNGTHGNFGVGGGCKKGSPTWGHLEYVDHGSGLDPTAPTPFNVHGTGVTGYFFVGPTTRDVSGTARTNDQSHPNVNYCVEVSDNDPGGPDTFVIQLTDTSGPFYTSTPSTVQGGNIEIHKHNPSNTGSFSSDTCLVSGGGQCQSQSCTSDDQCAACPGFFCSAQGSCQCAVTCTSNAECGGNSCVNGCCLPA